MSRKDKLPSSIERRTQALEQESKAVASQVESKSTLPLVLGEASISGAVSGTRGQNTDTDLNATF